MSRSFKGAVVNGVYKLSRVAKHPIVLISVVLVTVICLAAWHYSRSERAAREREDIHEAARIAVLLEHHVGRTVGELDRIIQFIRQSRERSDFQSDWARILSNKFTIHDQVALISVIDKKGMLVTSTSTPAGAKPVDLSDREHFKFHTYSDADLLFISKPVLGRVSGKWTIQFTRRMSDAKGDFDGVIVVSLDPSLLIASSDELNLGNKGGFGVLGSDGTVLAGFGALQASFGKRLEREFAIAGSEYLSGGTVVHRSEGTEGTAIVGQHDVKGLPLSVFVRIHDSHARALQLARVRKLAVLLLALSLIVVLGSALIADRLINQDFEVRYLARHDMLTGLANRAHFNSVLKSAFNGNSTEEGLALHLLDLDGFKYVNDTYGHPVGDKLLIEVGNRLKTNVRNSDVIARLGGDEFAVLQQGITSREQAQFLASRICNALSFPFHIDGINIAIGTSVGIDIVLDRPVTCTPAEMMSRADLALYSAKAEGRGISRFYSTGMQEAVNARLVLEQDLRRAVEENQFELHYQPIVTLDRQQVAGFEALVRWRHPERGLVPPGEFIPLAESTGLMLPIGGWVLHKACDDISKRPGNHKIAVNISPVQFRDPNLIATIRSALDASGLDPSRLELEITESTLMQFNSLTRSVLSEIDRMGIKIAMDDFGTGYSSLSYLQSFPISCIKIDRSFVNSLGTTTSGSGIVRAITSLANCLGMSTIAEGVETEAQRQELITLGCTEAQGYLFSKPKRADDILPNIEAAPAASKVAA
jgi:diguanylate cyclase (GGDEF)-like protein